MDQATKISTRYSAAVAVALVIFCPKTSIVNAFSAEASRVVQAAQAETVERSLAQTQRAGVLAPDAVEARSDAASGETAQAAPAESSILSRLHAGSWRSLGFGWF